MSVREILHGLADRLPAWLDPRPSKTITVAGSELHVIGEANIEAMLVAALEAATNMRGAHGTLPRMVLRVRGKDSLGLTPDKTRPRQGLFYHERDWIYFLRGHEVVIRHELYHAWAYALGLPYWKTIDHPGGYRVDGTPNPV